MYNLYYKILKLWGELQQNKEILSILNHQVSGFSVIQIFEYIVAQQLRFNII